MDHCISKFIDNIIDEVKTNYQINAIIYYSIKFKNIDIAYMLFFRIKIVRNGSDMVLDP